MGPRLRKSALTAHVAFSVGWLGAVAAFLALAVVGLTSKDADTVRAVHLAAEPLTWFLLVPLAFASLVTGLVQSLGTTWGLFRHYWVIFKLVINLFAVTVLLLYTETVSFLAGVAAESDANLRELQGPTFVLHSAAALVLLVAATFLAVYKPRGLTRYGRRKRGELRGVSPG